MIFRFGRFELDEELFELRCQGRSVQVQRRAIDTLIYLVRHRHHVVSKSELVSGPWSGTVVTDAAVAQVISVLRKALEDDAAAPTVIATVRGRGFRFVQSVLELERGAEAVVQSPGIQPRRVVANGMAEAEPPLPDLETEPASEPPSSLSRAVFAGRRAELATLHAALDEARAGHGGLVLVHGPAGIGKTCLVERFVDESRASGVDTYWGRCWAAQGTPPFWPWPELLQGFADRRGFQQMRSAAQAGLAHLAALLPELGASIDGSLDGKATESAYAKFGLLNAVCRFWERAARSTPLLLVLEDVHLADGDALELLEFACRSFGQTSLLLVATCRTLEASLRPTLGSALEGALPHVQCVELTGLTESDVVSWLEASGGTRRAARIGGPVQRATAGHPLLIANLVRLLPRGFGAEDLQVLRELRAPEPIAASIRAELATSGEGALELLRLASILGEVISLPVLASLAGKSLDDIMSRLEEPLRRGLLRLTGSGRVCFAHALVQNTLYRDLEPTRRKELHAAACQTFRQRLSERPEQVVQAAYHSMAAVPHVDLDEALQLASSAAGWARQHLAYAVAVEYCVRALHLLELGEFGARRRCELLQELARMQHLAGHSDAAVATYGELFELSRQADLGEMSAAALLGHYETRLELTILDEAYHVRLRETLARVRERGGLYARLLAVRAAVTYLTETGDSRLAWLEEALALALGSSDPSARLTVLHAASRAYLDLGDVRRLLVLADELLELASAQQLVEIAVDAGEFRAACLLELGWGKEFATEVARCVARATRIGHGQFLYSSRQLEGTRAFLGGDLHAAEVLARSAWSIGLALQGVAAESWFSVQLFALAMEAEGLQRNRLLREALHHCQHVLDGNPAFEPMRIQAACLRLELGDAEPASALLNQLVESGGVLGWARVDRFFVACLAQLAHLSWALAHEDAARTLRSSLRRYAGRHVMIAMGAAYWGPVSYWQGLLALTLGLGGEARTCFETAITESEGAWSTTWKAWAELRLATALASSERGEDVARRGSARSAAKKAAQTKRLPRLLAAADSAQ
jgi:DNA-binding winged helix-turn-helix (wHTH) protein/tetratricopeptide (TPR) repeat protein